MLELLSVMVTVETRDRLGVTASAPAPRPDSPAEVWPVTQYWPVTQVQVPVGDGGPRKHVWNGRGPFSISGPDPSPAARRVLRLDGRRPASGPVTVDTLAPEDFNESSIPQVYEPIYILYQYVSVCIDRYRGMYSCIQVGPFFSKYKNVCIGWYTHVFGHICTYMPRLLRPSRFWCSEAHSTESRKLSCLRPIKY